jgi:uncharacterized protein
LKRIAVRLTISALLLCIGSLWLIGSILSRSTNSVVPTAIAPAQEVQFSARDGSAIAGTYWPGLSGNAPGILLLHGNGGSRASLARTAHWLSLHGYAALAIDFRGHGESASSNHSFGWFESRDAHAALKWLKQRQYGAKIGVIGISLGGAASLIGDDGPLLADAFVFQAVYSDIRHAIRNRLANQLGWIAGSAIEPFLSYQSWLRQGVSPGRFSPLLEMKHIRAPVLVIGGGADKSTPPSETQSLYAATTAKKELWIIPNLDHNAVSGANDNAYLVRITAYFDTHLRPKADR